MDNNQVDIPSAKAELNKRTRKSYHTPHLDEYGNLQDLTQGSIGPCNDAAGSYTFQVSGVCALLIIKPVKPPAYTPYLPPLP
jgi:hypothetical protein